MLAASIFLGLRAQEISRLTYAMLLNPDGDIGDVLTLPDDVCKWGSGGSIPLAPNVRQLFINLKVSTHHTRPDDFVFISQKTGTAMSRQGVIDLFKKMYSDVGIDASSHSGRRYLISSAARKISTVGGSIYDVMRLARHKQVQTTMCYVAANTGAQRDVIALVSKALKVG
jgi:integrase/recombinase XerD